MKVEGGFPEREVLTVVVVVVEGPALIYISAPGRFGVEDACTGALLHMLVPGPRLPVWGMLTGMLGCFWRSLRNIQHDETVRL